MDNGGTGSSFSPSWVRDGTWGESNFPGASGCATRVTHQNSWCGVADVIGHYVDTPPPSPPPPSPPPLPPPPSPPSTVLTDPCSSSNLVCLLQSDTGCPSGCSASAQISPEPRFHGGATCSGGDHICTIYYWGSYTKLYFTLGGGQQSADSPAVLKKASADPLLCAEACLAEPSCTGAFFRFWSGECFVATAASPGAGNMMSTWVGQDAATQGGVTFVKWQG